MGRVKKREEKKENIIRKNRAREKENRQALCFWCVFPMISGSGGSKSMLAKAAGAEPCGQMMYESLRACCDAKDMSKSKFKHTHTQHFLTKFGSWHVEKVHTIVARSPCPNQNVQNAPFSDNFWKLTCRGAKQISKSTHTKHTMFGPRMEVDKSKKCTALRREAHVQVNMLKTFHVQTTFGRPDVVLWGRCKGLYTWSKIEENMQILGQFQQQPPLHYNYDYSYNYNTLPYTNYITLPSTSLRYTN